MYYLCNGFRNSSVYNFKKFTIMKYSLFVNGKLFKEFEDFKSAALSFRCSVDSLKQSNSYDDFLIQVIYDKSVILEN